MKHLVTAFLCTMLTFCTASTYAGVDVTYPSKSNTILIDGLTMKKEGTTIVRYFSKLTTALAAGTTAKANCPACVVEVVPGVITVKVTVDAPEAPECPVQEPLECPEPDVPVDPVDPVEPDPEPVVDEVVYRVNVGGAEVQVPGEINWAADPSVHLINPGSDIKDTSVLNSVHESVPENTPPMIFSTRRTDSAGGDEIQYVFSVEPGVYDVNVYVIDSYHSETGKRVQKFDIEGLFTRDLDAIESFGQGGGGMFSFNTTVVDGSIDIIATHVVANTTISAIEIVRVGDTSEVPSPPETPGGLVTGAVSLTWDNPTERVNGTPITQDELLAIRVHSVMEGGVEKYMDLFVGTDFIPYKMLTLEIGNWCFRLQAKDTDGRLSGYSNTVCKEVTEVE